MNVTSIKTRYMDFCKNRLRLVQIGKRNQGSRLRVCASASIKSDDEM